MTRFFLSWAEISNIEEIDKAMAKRFFIYGRAQRNWKPATYVNYHKTLLVFFRWCVDEGLISSNPVIDIEVPKIPKRIPSKLTKEDASRLLEVAYNYPYQVKDTFLRCRNHAVIAMFLYAGLRRGEIINLKFSDVDATHKTIFVRQGKGNKDRIVPMSYMLAESLLRYLQERKRLHKTCPEFFTSWQRNVGISVTSVRRLLTTVGKASGVKFSAHKLRHTFATLMLEGGCDIYSLSKMMGHGDIKTTTIYLAASTEHLRGQMNKHPLNKLR